jgi:hypothetical protein
MELWLVEDEKAEEEEDEDEEEDEEEDVEDDEKEEGGGRGEVGDSDEVGVMDTCCCFTGNGDVDDDVEIEGKLTGDNESVFEAVVEEKNNDGGDGGGTFTTTENKTEKNSVRVLVPK